MNLHLEGIRKLGAEVDLEGGYIIAKAPRLTGARIQFDVSSVGATGNVMMAAVLAHGTTVIQNAAIEPEITALAQFLVAMGAKIEGIGTNRLEIQGVDELHPADAETIPDRIEAGTFLVAGAMTGGTVDARTSDPDHLTAVITALEEAGCDGDDDPDDRLPHGAGGAPAGERHRGDLSRLPDGHAGAVDGADDDGRGDIGRHRHDLPGPLQARAGDGRGSGPTSSFRRTPPSCTAG